MSDGTSRFSGVAGQYDAVRPRPPLDLIDAITQWAGAGRPDVVDLGAGTGLSALAWAGRAATVAAVEPSAGMRAVAERRIAGPAQRAGTRFTVRDATAEATGLPDGCADVVTASQAMHWFDPDRALPEIARLLRPGGVLAAYDCDWPPCIDWETGAAWERMARLVDEEHARRGLPALHRGKEHLPRIRGSALFRHAELIAVAGRERGDADRLVAVALSAIAHAAEFLADGCTEEQLGLTALRDVAARRLAQPRIWWWTYRVHLAVR
ncbi:MAG TPA: class I SAM-dependent methyltransferase [Streptosporangiaceae bacterium]|nr:class I SAM-dependent methyltransferase [Streptosporangiaceae bacterium]